MKSIFVATFLGCFFLSGNLTAQKTNVLEGCWTKQVKPLGKMFMSMGYKENKANMNPSFDPFRVSIEHPAGTIWFGVDQFIKQDSVAYGKRQRKSIVQYNQTDLLVQEYGARSLSPVSKTSLQRFLLLSARYTPLMIINYFKEKNASPAKESNSYFTQYNAKIDNLNVSLNIRNSDSLAYQFTVVEDDELFGDVSTIYTYDSFQNLSGLICPKNIVVTKMNGLLADHIFIGATNTESKITPLLIKPANYNYTETAAVKPEINTENYSDNIHFINLLHTRDKVMVVEFSNFVLVADAPLNTENGELIIREVKKMAPGKPIKYFTFGHHHPHSIGGLRAFVHEGSKIIVTDANQEFVKKLANAKHTIKPDILEKEPKTLSLDLIQQKTEKISDGKYDMMIYELGATSQHTSDFIFYYFPKEKLIFQDDLLNLDEKGQFAKGVIARQTALYNAIKTLKLDVTHIVQGSLVMTKEKQPVATFADLEKTINEK